MICVCFVGDYPTGNGSRPLSLDHTHTHHPQWQSSSLKPLFLSFSSFSLSQHHRIGCIHRRPDAYAPRTQTSRHSKPTLFTSSNKHRRTKQSIRKPVAPLSFPLHQTHLLIISSIVTALQRLPCSSLSSSPPSLPPLLPFPPLLRKLRVAYCHPSHGLWRRVGCP